ncbi:Uncharacterized membrane protein YeiB [Saccharopolyspora shandongensis]|uniref:Uncharacterized membrane protein YeiB n=1 Tax=Saccharopolyspora shandongensis TaxID=418495 RepID=A0A1H3JBL4_9PSEU|nr:DUF418 domain-containing protein [Saccharopolyspora shandongensis]SDY36969.1 Uncharacterized membrane protein YeiB [Saccharopolyspora shandongensis]
MSNPIPNALGRVPGAPLPPVAAVPPGKPAAKRIVELDVLRGFALCGILLVNIPPMMHMDRTVDYQVLPVPHVFDMFVQQRFFPIFSLLFGVGFGLFLASAGQRSAHPRVVFLRRLVVLAGLGIVHQCLQPGEALLPYAILGLVVLLPMSFLPWWANLPIGAALIAASTTFASGGISLVPGMMLTGFALAQSGLPATLHRRAGQIAIVFAAAVVASAGFLVLQEQDPLNAGFTHSSAAAGLFMAIAYATGLLLLMRTPARSALSAVFEPLGRMALTNYVTATLLVLLLGPLVGLWESAEWGALIPLAAGILVVQIVWSRLWLAHFRYGPLEWVWRCATWWSIVPNRRVTA